VTGCAVLAPAMSVIAAAKAKPLAAAFHPGIRRGVRVEAPDREARVNEPSLGSIEAIRAPLAPVAPEAPTPNSSIQLARLGANSASA